MFFLPPAVPLLAIIANNVLLYKKLSSICEPKDDYDSEHEVSEGTLKKMYTYNGKPISFEEAVYYFDEEVTSVKHFACSLEGFGFFSQIISVITVPLFGKAARHEFVIVYAKDHMFFIEVAGDPDGPGDKMKAIVQINIIPASTEKGKEWQTKRILEKLDHPSVLNQIEEGKISKLNFGQVNSMITYWIKFARAGNQGYTLFQKNCKSLARSLEGFCRDHTDLDEYLSNVMTCMLGLFVDKPFGFDGTLASYLYEKKAIEKIDKKEVKELVMKIREIVADIRTSTLPYKSVKLS